ncbi:MAG: hypothetical protein GY694_05490, partial [Gammaproteobacteria bacterium]|nr:hypothetical protein [Gammaproteobacteria bacterium]
GVSVAASGAASVGALIGANVVTNSVVAEIDSSTVDSGAKLSLDALNKANILGLTVGVAGSGAGAGLLSLSGNTIVTKTRAAISGRTSQSDIDAVGDVQLSASNISEINTLAVGVSASGGGAGGAALAANVITNTIETEISNSVVDITGGNLDLHSSSSAIIRALTVGVSGSGGAAVQVSAMGNVIANTSSAIISSDSVVTASGNISLLADDINPGVVPFMDAVGEYILGEDQKQGLSDALAGTPFDPSANIVSLMVSVAGSGGVAVNGAFTGNVITNTVTASIDDSDVRSTGGDISITSDSRAGILALTVGVAGSGAVAVNATGFGNDISNNISAAISDGSVVTTDTGDIDLSASDIS